MTTSQSLDGPQPPVSEEACDETEEEGTEIDLLIELTKYALQGYCSVGYGASAEEVADAAVSTALATTNKLMNIGMP